MIKLIRLSSLILVTLFYSLSGASQTIDTIFGCDNIPPPGTGPVCTICNFDILYGSTFAFSASPEAGWCGTIENDQYIGFVAGGTGSVVFEMTAFNCVNGNGLQVGIYDQNNNLVGDCFNQVFPDFSQVFTAGGLEAGEVYYIRIDGFAGDGCEFNIRVISGLSGGQPAPISNISGPTSICLDGDFRFNVPSSQSGEAVRWSVSPGIKIPDFSVGNPNSLSTPAGSTDGFLDVNFVGAASTLAPGECDTVNISAVPYNICFPQDTVTSITVDVCRSLLQDTTLITGSYAHCDTGYVYSVTGERFTEGIYHFLNVDGNQQVDCDDLIRLEVTQIGTPMQVSLTDSVIVCDNDGEIMLTVTGGVPPFTYLWNDGSTDQNRSNLSAGRYQVEVTDQEGCRAFGVTFLEDITNISIPLNFTTTDCDQDDAIAYIDSGLFDDYDISWSTGETTDTITGLGIGRYQLTLTNRISGCTLVTVFNIQVDPACFSTVTGRVVYDAAVDCNQSSIYNPLINAMVISSDGQIRFTNNDGFYEFLLDTGQFTITVQNPNPTILTETCDLSHTINIPSYRQTFQGNNFHFIGEADNDLSITIGKNPPNTARPNTIFVTVCNDGNLTASSTVNLDYPRQQELTSSIPQVLSNDTIADVLTWEINNLAPGSCSVLKATFTRAPLISLGTIYIYQAFTDSFTTNNDATPFNNVVSCSSTVRGSYDPNDKAVTPAGIGPEGFIEQTDTISKYRIRFQNTGTANALYVRLEDTLSSHFDINTFKILSASHDFEAKIVDENALIVEFNNIELPPESIDSVGSNGFFSYSIELKNDLPFDTEIENTAYIYFDFNPPIITNTTLNTIASPVVNVEDLPQARISLFPNPTSGDLNLRLENSTHQISNIQLIGLDGRLISEFTVQQRDQAYFIPLHEMSMNNGLYFLQVKLTSGEKINKRFVIQR